MELLRRKGARKVPDRGRSWVREWGHINTGWFSAALFPMFTEFLTLNGLVGSRISLLLKKLRTQTSCFCSFSMPTPIGHALNAELEIYNKMWKCRECQQGPLRSMLDTSTEQTVVSCSQERQQTCPTSMDQDSIFIKSPSVVPNFFWLALQHSQ